MRVTCLCDDYSNMGYIYLQPPAFEINPNIRSKNEINQHFNQEDLELPYITDNPAIPALLDHMQIADETFQAGYGQSYDTEYGNDIDKEGYVIGIELTLSESKLIEHIRNKNFRVYQVVWNNKQVHLATFDEPEAVFDPGNIIYKCSAKEDAFVIVKLVQPEDIGIRYSDQAERKPIALIKALISSKEDKYPLSYLLESQIYLHSKRSSI